MRPRNLIVVLVDTLRADHLASYGYSRTTSPVFDRFAAASLFLAEARSQASCTFPSANAILTGRYPVRFLGQPGGRMGIPAETPSLATMLRSRGFATAAVSASPIVRARRTKFNPTGGFDAGFDLFDEDCLWREAACVTARAADWLCDANGGRPAVLPVPATTWTPTVPISLRPGTGCDLPGPTTARTSFASATPPRLLG